MPSTAHQMLMQRSRYTGLLERALRPDEVDAAMHDAMRAAAQRHSGGFGLEAMVKMVQVVLSRTLHAPAARGDAALHWQVLAHAVAQSIHEDSVACDRARHLWESLVKG